MSGETTDRGNGASIKVTTMVGIVVCIVSLALGAGGTAGMFQQQVSDHERRITQIEQITREMGDNVQRIKTDVTWLRRYIKDATDHRDR